MKRFFSKFWQEEEAQGTTEYILIVLVVVGLAMVFRTQISDAVSGKLNELSSSITNFGN